MTHAFTLYLCIWQTHSSKATYIAWYIIWGFSETQLTANNHFNTICISHPNYKKAALENPAQHINKKQREKWWNHGLC